MSRSPSAPQSPRPLDPLALPADTHGAREEHLRLIADHIPVLIVKCDREGRYTFANAPYTQRFGLSPDQVVGRSIGEVIGPHAFGAIAPQMDAALRGERVEFEQEVPYASGARWMHCIYVPEKDRDGAVTGVVAVIQDISARKQAEARERLLTERALAATQKFEAVFNQSGLFAAILTLDGVLREVNDMAVDWCGYTREQVVGKHFWETPWWRGSEDVKARIRAATKQATSGVTFREVLPYWVAGGTERVVEFAMHPIRDSFGAVKFLNPTGIDITDRTRTERALRMQIERTALLSQTLGELLTADAPGTIVSELFPRVGAHVKADAFFNFMVDESGTALQLHACLGIPEQVARSIKRLEFGQAVCGRVAQQRRPIHAMDIQSSTEPATDLVRSLGIQAYYCNPLIVGQQLLGTLSFASRSRTRFDQHELEFLTTVSQYVAIAMHRLRSEPISPGGGANDVRSG